MGFPAHKVTELWKELNEKKIIELAKKLEADGQVGLIVDKEKVSVKNLSFLEHYGFLKGLTIRGLKAGLAAIKGLKQLEELDLMRVKKFQCSVLSDLPQLKELHFNFMSIASWDGIAELVNLEELSLYKVTGLANLEFLAQLPQLQSLHIEECKEVTSIPDLSNISQLTHVWLAELPNLECIDGLFKAPALKKLVFAVTPKLQPDDLRPALDHPTLEYVSPALEECDDPKNERVAELLKDRFGDVFEDDPGDDVWK